jgi:alpha-tubulin suppressor-like RCC1 family protein
LGDEATVDKATPTQTAIISLIRIVRISAGYHHSLFLASNGFVYAVGGNGVPN